MFKLESINPKELFRARVLLSLVLLGLVFITYTWTLNYEFVWDDYDLIDTSSESSMSEFTNSLTNRYLFKNETQEGYSYYRPVTSLLIKLEKSIFGFNPLGYRLMNIVYHSIVVLLLFFFVRELSRKNNNLAFIAAAIFAVHPLHTESIVWISGRTDLLSTLFVLAGLLAHYNYAHGKKITRNLILVSLFYFLAVFSKETAYIFILLILILDILVYSRDRDNHVKKRLLLYPVLLLITLITILIRVNVVGIEFSQYLWFFPNPIIWLVSAFATLGKYILRIFYPFNPDAYIINPYQEKMLAIEPVFGLAILAGFIILFFKLRKKSPILAFFSSLIILSILPALNIARIPSPLEMGFTMADRFTYMAGIGMAYIFSYIIFEFLKPPDAEEKHKKRITIFTGHRHVLNASMLIVILFISITLLTTSKWSNNETFYKNQLKKHPNSFLLNANLAFHYYQTGNFTSALKYTNLSLDITEAFKTEILNLRSAIYYRLNKEPEALQDLVNANTISPGDVTTLHNLATLYLKLDAPDQALEKYKLAESRNKHLLENKLGIAISLQKLGDSGKAEEHYEALIKGYPGNKRVRINYANWLFENLKPDPARKIYMEYYKGKDLSLTELYQFSRNLTLYTNELDLARDIAIQIYIENPDFIEVYPLIVEIYMQKGEYTRAENWIKYADSIIHDGSSVSDLLEIKQSEINEKIKNS